MKEPAHIRALPLPHEPAELQAYLFYDLQCQSQALQIEEELQRKSQGQPLCLYMVDMSGRDMSFLQGPARLPQLELGPYVLTGERLIEQVDEFFDHAVKRYNQALQNHETIVYKQFTQAPEPSAASKLARWFNKHFLSFFLALLTLYLSLPLTAPVLMKAGLNIPARLIYTAYKPLCHQLAYRSFFLFGEQAVYPLEAAHVHGLQSYESSTGLSPDDLMAARKFLGNERLGYKVALCERDMAIYCSMLLFGLIFALTGRRNKGISWLVWLVFGLIPIGLDGFSQLISQMRLPFLSFLAFRESTPLLRVLTGGLFGWFTGWFGFPALNEVFEESRAKQARMEAILSGERKSI